MCEVLRCGEPGRQIIELPAPEGAPSFQAAVCDEHHERIEAGEKWVWQDEVNPRESHILMGADLDAGGAVVLGAWKYVEKMGVNELIIECTAPSGAPREPLRAWISAEEMKAFLRSFRHAFPEAFAHTPPSESSES